MTDVRGVTPVTLPPVAMAARALALVMLDLVFHISIAHMYKAPKRSHTSKI